MDNVTVIVGINHYPHVNFFKHAIRVLKEKGINIVLIVQPRGNLTTLVEHELGLPYISLGRHEPGLLRKALNLSIRDVKVFNYLRKNNFSAVTGVGSIELSHSAFILNKPSIIFDDDTEHLLSYYCYKYFAKRIVVPSHIPVRGRNILKYKGFKELAYLHPNHFSPRTSVLNEYGLKMGGYAFLREVSNSSTNYYGLKEGFLAGICPELKNRGYDIVLSLENKQLKNLFAKHCIILEEPVSDIHSLMHFAAFTIASGDSMSRESCLLGTPAIYTGGRDMSINTELEKRGCFLRCGSDKEQILNLVSQISRNKLKEQTLKIIGESIASEWEDTTEVIINNLFSLIYRDNSYIEKYEFRR